MEEPYIPQKFSDRVHDVCHIQIACGDLMQHGREQGEVLSIDQCDLHIGFASGAADTSTVWLTFPMVNVKSTLAF
jgi:hypothetical protein